MIAIFCKYERDFKELEFTPQKMFVKIRNVNDIRGRTFTGVLKLYDWYRGEKDMLYAYDVLRERQPELFD